MEKIEITQSYIDQKDIGYENLLNVLKSSNTYSKLIHSEDLFLK